MYVKKRSFRLLPKLSDNYISFALISLMIYGTLMITSAEMGESAGDSAIILNVLFRQAVYLSLGLFAYILLSRVTLFKFSKSFYIPLMSLIFLAILASTRFFGAVGGAYAWIRIGSFTIQPSEFAKVFIIVLFAKVLTSSYVGEEEMRKAFRQLIYVMLAYAVIIVGLEKDTGSGAILFAMAYILLLIPKNKAIRGYQMWMLLLLIIGIVLIIFILSPVGTALLENLGSSNYMISRFLSSANPFKDQYSSGYHLVMSLVAIATGGLFGVGYGNSVHKYMNFPNPSNDFILVVIVEEVGVVGFMLVVVLYAFIIIRLTKHAMSKNADLRAKMVFLGVILYFALHFILNVGGVSGLIPLTGVPLLLMSSGGSSAMACMCALGIAQNEIVRIRSKDA